MIGPLHGDANIDLRGMVADDLEASVPYQGRCLRGPDVGHDQVNAG